MFEQCSDLLTIKELQAALHIGRNKAYQLIRSGEIKSIKVGNAIRIPKLYFIEYVRNLCYTVNTVDGCSGLMEVTQ